MLSKTDKDKEAEEKRRGSEQNQKAIENIQKKISAPIALVGVRIVVSAGDSARVRELLTTLQSAFAQFENTRGNKISFEEVKGKSLQSHFHAFSFRDKASVPIPLNLTELTTLVHFPVRSHEGAREMKEAKAGTAPAPIEIPREGIVLGVNKHRGSETLIRMAPKDRLRHMYFVGQTGTGKSVMLTNMILQDIQNGEGCCFMDPHGNDVQYILANIPPERYEDVIYFDPSYMPRPFGLNMLEYDPRFPEQKTFVVNEMLSIFNKLFDMKVAGGPAFEQYFRNATLLIMEHPESGNTLLDIARVMSDKTYRDMKLSHSKAPTINQFWQNAEKTSGEQSLANFVPYITNKFDVFLSNEIMRPIVAQEKSSFNVRDIMDNKKIFLVNLSKGRLGDINANLIGLIIVGKILMAALSRVDLLGQDFPPFYLYIDEFQNVTTPSISQIFSEARKYKLSLNVAHQYIKQLDEGIRDSVFGNVGSLGVFRVSAEDAEFLEKQFAPVFTAKDIMNVENWNAYIKLLANGVPLKAFSVETLPPPEGSTDHLAALKELSYLKYGRPREEVEYEIMRKYAVQEKVPEARPANPFL